MREELDSRRHTAACNQVAECLGEEGGEVEDKTRYKAS